MMTGQWLCALIERYQTHVSPHLGERCRFFPSCSHYAKSCIEMYRLPTALRKIAWRLARCQAWHPGGVDLP
jgi:uncharacterized protein